MDNNKGYDRMTNPINITGTWKGFFSYGEEYGEELYNQKVYFRLHLKSNGYEFEGTGVDTEGIGANFETATVKGFIEDDSINFVKQYPFYHAFNEDGTTYQDKTKPQPKIHYTGSYNSRRKKYSGEWEMVEHSEQFGDGWLEDVCTGKWEIEKEE